MSCAIRQRIIYIRLWQRSRHLIQAREIRNEEKGQPCGHGHSFQEDMIQGSRIQGFEGSSENLKKQSTLDPLNPRSLEPLFAVFLRTPVTTALCSVSKGCEACGRSSRTQQRDLRCGAPVYCTGFHEFNLQSSNIYMVARVVPKSCANMNYLQV
jgi:hypothetical protein